MSLLKSTDPSIARAPRINAKLSQNRFAIPLLTCGLLGGLVSGCGHLNSIENEEAPRVLATEASPSRTQPTFPELNEDSTQDDYLIYAALNNAGLKAAFNRWTAALERNDQVTALPDPRLAYSYYFEEGRSRSDPQKQELGLTQTFPWFGKRRLLGESADATAKAAQQELEKAKLSLFSRVKVAYHEYWYLSRAIAVTKEHLQLVTNLERVARTRFSAGLVPNSAVIQAQVELGKLDDRLKTFEAQRAPIVAKLNAALNRSLDLPLPWPRTLPETTASFTDEQAVQALIENNPDLRRLDHLVTKEEASIQLAKKSDYPDISLGVEYMDMGEADSSMAESGKNTVMAMVSVNIPLWYDKYRAEAREARFRKTAFKSDRMNTQNQLRADLAFALYQFRDAERKINLYGDTLIPKATQSMKVTQEGFETGKESFIALIDTQRLLLEFQLSHERAKADRGERLAEIEMLTGMSLDTQQE